MSSSLTGSSSDDPSPQRRVVEARWIDLGTAHRESRLGESWRQTESKRGGCCLVLIWLRAIREWSGDGGNLICCHIDVSKSDVCWEKIICPGSPYISWDFQVRPSFLFHGVWFVSLSGHGLNLGCPCCLLDGLHGSCWVPQRCFDAHRIPVSQVVSIGPDRISIGEFSARGTILLAWFALW